VSFESRAIKQMFGSSKAFAFRGFKVSTVFEIGRLGS
jgi:hypothetical protein